jgi:hypothetical protein
MKGTGAFLVGQSAVVALVALVAVVALVALAGCSGGPGTLEGGSDAGAADGGGNAHGNGNTPAPLPVVPAECAAATDGPVASELTLRFVNEGATPLWMGSTCSQPLFTVRTCIDGYERPIAPGDCNECSQDACRECPGSAAVCVENIEGVPAGEAHTATWETRVYTKGRLGGGGGGCDCYARHAAPAGKYRVRVGVFTSEPAEGSGADPDYEVDVDVELPHDGPIDVRVDR